MHGKMFRLQYGKTFEWRSLLDQQDWIKGLYSSWISLFLFKGETLCNRLQSDRKDYKDLSKRYNPNLLSKTAERATQDLETVENISLKRFHINWKILLVFLNRKNESNSHHKLKKFQNILIIFV